MSRVPKKPVSEAKKRASKINLAKAHEKRRANKLKADMLELGDGIKDLEGKIEGEVEKQVKGYLKTVDRKKLKNEILHVFDDLGGRKFVKKWAKENPGKYLNLVKDILKTETESGGGGGGVTVNIFGLKDEAIDITPQNP